MVSVSCGGGGYGAAVRARRSERVAEDVREGWVSRERARAVYRVALTDDGEIDEAETARLRREQGRAPD